MKSVILIGVPTPVYSELKEIIEKFIIYNGLEVSLEFQNDIFELVSLDITSIPAVSYGDQIICINGNPDYQEVLKPIFDQLLCREM